jgi:uncharacterized membrane protein (DUF4010 family)
MRPFAWSLATAAVTIAQVLMWDGWNASGNWISVEGTDAIWSYALCAAFMAAPIVLALALLRTWTGLAVVLAATVLLGLVIGDDFRTNDHSTAGFAWFAPFLLGMPFVGACATAEWAIGSIRHR